MIRIVVAGEMDSVTKLTEIRVVTHITEHGTDHRPLTIKVQGRYRRADWPGAWRQTHWRLWTSGTGWGAWYKVHGNQKKDHGSLKLVENDAPETVLPRTVWEEDQYRRLIGVPSGVNACI